MHSRLLEIIAQKEKEVLIRKSSPLSIRRDRPVKSLQKALQQKNAVIAEIKRHSPANGPLSEIADPVKLAIQYQTAGAAAISVLTDELFFKGSLNDLKSVSHALQNTDCAILRKDFIIDIVQIDEAYHFGADAILLIVAVTQDKTQSLIDYAHDLGLDVLLEVHDKSELDFALTTSATIMGVNNRNLHTFEVSVNNSLEMIKYIPPDITSVAESGIADIVTAEKLYAAGFNALLIGEALVKHKNPAEFIYAIRGVK